MKRNLDGLRKLWSVRVVFATRSIVFFLLAAWLSSNLALAATYNLPAQIGSFSGCSFTSGTTYTCTGNFTLGNNDSINFTSAMTLQVNGNFTVGNNSNLNNSGGHAVSILANGNITLGNSNYAAINFSAGGNFQAGNTASITGNISAAGNVVLGNSSTVNGNVSAGGALSVGSGSTINGSCTYSSTNYTCSSVAPTATTSAASSLSASGATLNGVVSSNGSSTTVTFEYGLTTSYGSTTTAAQSPLAGGVSSSAVSKALTGLDCGTTYHYRVKAVNSAGTTYGSNVTFTTSACTVVADYRFDECAWTSGSAGAVTDSAGSYAGTPYNVSTASGGVVQRAADLSATGTSDYIQWPAGLLHGRTDFTIALWFKTTLNQAQQEILHGLGANTGDDEIEIYLINTTQIQVNLLDAGNTYTAGSAFNDGSWHHLAVTRSGTSVCVYLDATSLGCNTRGAGALSIPTANALLTGQEQDAFGGSFASNQSLSAQLDEFKIFGNAFSSTQIASIRTNELAGNNWDGTTRSLTCLPQLSVGNASVTEGNSGTTNLLFPVTLNQATSVNVTATYALTSGTATGAAACGGTTDFVSTGGSVSITAGATNGTISIPVCGDTTYEGDESFTVTLSSPVNATLATATATGIILNDDAPPLVAEYRFDEVLWNGTSNEVLDTSGNGYHAASTLAVTGTGSPGPAYTAGAQSTCRYGVFDGGSISKSYIQLPSSFPALSGSFSLSAWINSTNASAQHQRIFVRDDNDDGWALSLADGTGTGILRFFNRNVSFTSPSGGVVNAGGVAIDTTFQLSSNTWYFVALTVDTVGKTVVMYAYDTSGVQRAKMSASFTGTWGAGTGATAIGGETSASSEGRQTSWHFLGRIDEVRIYSGALTQTLVESLLTNTRSCSCALGSFRIAQTSTALACPDTRATVTIEPMCADGTTVKSDYAGTVSLSTLPVGGSYYSAASGGSAITSLTFVAGDLAKSAYLYNPNESSLCAVATDGAVSTTSTSCTSFHAYGFRVSSSPGDVACGNPSSLTLSAYGKNESGAGCSVITGFSGNKNIKAWFTSGVDTDNPTTVQASNRTLSITGSASGISNAAEPASANLTNVPFSNGTATLTLSYPNAAKIFGINFKHDASPYNGTTCAASAPFCALTAQTNAFVVYPASFALSVTDSGSACTSSYTGCSAFKKAGESFNMKLQALCADGSTLATDYKNGGTAIALGVNSLLSPAGGDFGSVGTAAVSITSGGEAGFAQTWSEVGVPTFKATPPTWFGRSFTAATTGGIGRFYPSQFVLSLASITPAGGMFTYMDQPFGIGFTLTAVNASGGTTTNYTTAGGYAKLDPTNTALWPSTTLGSTGFAIGAKNGSTDLSTRLSLSGTPTGSWTAGVAAITANLKFSRPTTTTADTTWGAYDALDIGVAPQDSDGVVLASAVLDLDASTPAGSERKKLSATATKQRFGRLRLLNAYGSELLNPRVEYRAEYWDGTRWTTHTLDNSSPLVAGNLATGGLSVNGITGLTNGVGFITFNTAGVGSYDIAANLNSSGDVTSCNATNPAGVTAANKEWLQGFWSSSCNGTAAWQQDPNARVKLGSPKAPYIYLRERY